MGQHLAHLGVAHGLPREPCGTPDGWIPGLLLAIVHLIVLQVVLLALSSGVTSCRFGGSGSQIRFGPQPSTLPTVLSRSPSYCKRLNWLFAFALRYIVVCWGEMSGSGKSNDNFRLLIFINKC